MNGKSSHFFPFSARAATVAAPLLLRAAGRSRADSSLDTAWRQSGGRGRAAGHCAQRQRRGVRAAAQRCVVLLIDPIFFNDVIAELNDLQFESKLHFRCHQKLCFYLFVAFSVYGLHHSLDE